MRSALQQCVDALERIRNEHWTHWPQAHVDLACVAITAAREALAEPPAATQPVAHLHKFRKKTGGRRYAQANLGGPSDYPEPEDGFEWIGSEPLYAAPPQAPAQAPEVRLDGDALDELVGTGQFHLENMDANVWWMELRNDAGGVAVLLSARGKITAQYERRK